VLEHDARSAGLPPAGSSRPAPASSYHATPARSPGNLSAFFPPSLRRLFWYCIVQMKKLFLQGDPSQYSVYREEAIEAIVAALEHSSQSRKVQEQCARALLILAGRFSSSGEPVAEAWLLKRAGLDDSLSESFRRSEVFKDKSVRAVCTFSSNARKRLRLNVRVFFPNRHVCLH
jgi:hypothetical protein